LWSEQLSIVKFSLFSTALRFLNGGTKTESPEELGRDREEQNIHLI
jgi:hypothetical protein